MPSNSSPCPASQKRYNRVNETCSGSSGLFNHGLDFGRGNFSGGHGQAVVSCHRVHRVRRRVRQARLHAALTRAWILF